MFFNQEKNTRTRTIVVKQGATSTVPVVHSSRFDASLAREGSPAQFPAEIKHVRFFTDVDEENKQPDTARKILDAQGKIKQEEGGCNWLKAFFGCK